MLIINNINWEFDLDVLYDDHITFKKDNNIFYIDVKHIKIGIIGNIKDLALYFAVFIQGTLDVIDEDDMIFDAFVFSTTGKIITTRWQVSNIEQVNNFIIEYNRIYDTVGLLK